MIILFVLTSLIRHKKRPAKVSGEDRAAGQVKCIGDFTLAPAPSDSAISSASSRSSLMFKFFGKSLSSFDLEKAAPDPPGEQQKPSPSCFVVRVDEPRLYQQNILVGSSGGDKEPQTFKYIQTIAC